MIPLNVHNMKGFLDRVIIDHSQNPLSLSNNNTGSVSLKLLETILNSHPRIKVRLLLNGQILNQLLKVLTWGRFVLSFPEHLLDRKRETGIAGSECVLKDKDNFHVLGRAPDGGNRLKDQLGRSVPNEDSMLFEDLFDKEKIFRLGKILSCFCSRDKIDQILVAV